MKEEEHGLEQPFHTNCSVMSCSEELSPIAPPLFCLRGLMNPW
jgi:hypothetical protein